ncbi:hypothetical protein pb186bvf_002342 [Paramecium bursaria]
MRISNYLENPTITRPSRRTSQIQSRSQERNVFPENLDIFQQNRARSNQKIMRAIPNQEPTFFPRIQLLNQQNDLNPTEIQKFLIKQSSEPQQKVVTQQQEQTTQSKPQNIFLSAKLDYPKQEESIKSQVQRRKYIIKSRKRPRRKIKHIFLFAQALVRFLHQIKCKNPIWHSQRMEALQQIQEVQLRGRRYLHSINNWAQFVLTKCVSVLIHQPPYREFDFNIQSHDKKVVDNQILIQCNIIRLLLQDLAQYAEIAPQEVLTMLYLEQYSNFRTQFSEFVSTRTLYINSQNSFLSINEKIMIFSEALIYKILIPSLLNYTHMKILDIYENPNYIFQIRCIISFIQYLFMEQFKEIPIQENTFKTQQKQLGKSQKDGLVITIVDQIYDKPIKGDLPIEQIQPLLSNIFWVEKMSSIFQQSLYILLKRIM